MVMVAIVVTTVATGCLPMGISEGAMMVVAVMVVVAVVTVVVAMEAMPVMTMTDGNDGDDRGGINGGGTHTYYLYIDQCDESWDDVGGWGERGGGGGGTWGWDPRGRTAAATSSAVFLTGRQRKDGKKM
jgi:hypothetical protein